MVEQANCDDVVIAIARNTCVIVLNPATQNKRRTHQLNNFHVYHQNTTFFARTDWWGNWHRYLACEYKRCLCKSGKKKNTKPMNASLFWYFHAYDINYKVSLREGLMKPPATRSFVHLQIFSMQSIRNQKTKPQTTAMCSGLAFGFGCACELGSCGLWPGLWNGRWDLACVFGLGYVIRWYHQPWNKSRIWTLSIRRYTNNAVRIPSIDFHDLISRDWVLPCINLDCGIQLNPDIVSAVSFLLFAWIACYIIFRNALWYSHPMGNTNQTQAMIPSQSETVVTVVL